MRFAQRKVRVRAMAQTATKEKVVLAYSGGLDTSVCLKWLQVEKGLDVIAVCGNVGQDESDLAAIKQKAIDMGGNRFLRGRYARGIRQ